MNTSKSKYACEGEEILDLELDISVEGVIAASIRVL